MTQRRVLLAGVVVAGLAISGAGVASALMDLPQDAVPAAADPVGDALRETARPPAPAQPQPSPGSTPAPPDPAPTPPEATPPLVIIAGEDEAEPEEEADTVEEPEPAPAEPPAALGRRQRRPVAVIQAVDKTTAESMRFEVEVGGRPVRFSKTLIFKARACEVSAPDERTEDAIAYLEIGLQARGLAGPAEARQIFKGWMFASSPGLNGLEHPIYDAWVVGCRA